VNSGYVPLGGAIVDAPLAKLFEDHVLWQGLTYSGHALACAAGVATIQAYKDERVIENAAAMGELLGRELLGLMERHPSVGDVRGKGLMWGIELVKDRGTKEMLERWNGPSQKLATALRNALMQRDVYMICRWNLMIVAPPLIVTDDQLRVGIRAIDQALEIADRYAATGDM
jgi:taurine--2-oxoglutarate transaminase